MSKPTLMIICGDEPELVAAHLQDWLGGVAAWSDEPSVLGELCRRPVAGDWVRLHVSTIDHVSELRAEIYRAGRGRRVVIVCSAARQRTLDSLPPWLSDIDNLDWDVHVLAVLGSRVHHGRRPVPLTVDLHASAATWIQRLDSARIVLLGPRPQPIVASAAASGEAAAALH